MPAFAIRLNSPTSTSKQLSVATNFAKRDGIIIELQNDWHIYQYQTFFDCSWISNFKEEDERLWFGGSHMIRMVSVRIVDTAKNYEEFFTAFHAFDYIVSTGGINDETLKNKYIKIVKNCIDYMIGQSNNNFDTYVNDTFYLFCIKKTQVVINLHNLCCGLSKSAKLETLTNYLVTSVMEEEEIYDETECTNRNMVNKQLFKIFPNVQEIIIYAGEKNYKRYHRKTYSFSLQLFLDVIEQQKSWNKISIKAYHHMSYGKSVSSSWLKDYFTTTIKQAFNEKNINIHLKEHIKNIMRKARFNTIEDCLIIERP
eukprot:505236_1